MGVEESAVRRNDMESRADGERTTGAVEDEGEVPRRRQGLIFLHSM